MGPRKGRIYLGLGWLYSFHAKKKSVKSKLLRPINLTFSIASNHAIHMAILASSASRASGSSGLAWSILQHVMFISRARAWVNIWACIISKCCPRCMGQDSRTSGLAGTKLLQRMEVGSLWACLLSISSGFDMIWRATLSQTVPMQDWGRETRGPGEFI